MSSASHSRRQLDPESGTLPQRRPGLDRQRRLRVPPQKDTRPTAAVSFLYRIDGQIRSIEVHRERALSQGFLLSESESLANREWLERRLHRLFSISMRVRRHLVLAGRRRIPKGTLPLKVASENYRRLHLIAISSNLPAALYGDEKSKKECEQAWSELAVAGRLLACAQENELLREQGKSNSMREAEIEAKLNRCAEQELNATLKATGCRTNIHLDLNSVTDGAIVAHFRATA